MATHDVAPGTGTPPGFTILVVVRHTDPKHLLELIYSLIHQQYEGWECVFIDNAAGRSRPQAIVKVFQKRDCRFSLHRVGVPKSDLFCLDYGLQFASGDFVTVVEDTGMLSSGALHEAASFLMCRPHIDAVFTDADMMDDEGVIHASCFKAGCPVDALVSQVHQQPLAFLSRRYLSNVGGFASLAKNGSLGGKIDAEYIPHSLYHKRDMQSKIRKKRIELNVRHKFG